MNRSRRFIAAAVLLTLLCGCSRAQQDWQAAQRAGTPGAYRVFVERHPNSELAAVARQRIAELSEEDAWQQAARANTAAAYREYLARYPQGSWSQDARIRIESKSLAAEAPPGSGPNPGGAESIAAPVRPASAAHPGAPATAGAPASAAGYAVQLGSFSSGANARAAWVRLASTFRPQLRGLDPNVVPVTVSGRRLYRLEARVASQDAARRLCRQLQRQSQGCLPLP